MISDIKPYPVMKDSGIEWLGEVPEHWGVVTFRSIGSARKGRQPQQLKGVDGKESGIPYLSMNFLRPSHTDALEYAIPEPGLVMAEEGDILLLWDGANAGEFFRAKKGVVSSTSALIHLYNIQSDYFSYASTIIEPTLRAFTVGMGIPHVSGKVLKNLRLPIPSLPEQNAIVRYLDYVDRRVRRLVQAKRKLVALLTEQKQAIIHHAVTRGLDSDVPMKDSGVEWLGEVPEHWDVRKLKQCCDRFYAGGTPDSGTAAFYCDPQKGIPWLMISDMTKQRRIRSTQKHITEEGRESRNLECLPIGTLLYSMYASLGVVSILEIEATVNQAIIGLEPRSEVMNREFCLYSLENLRPHMVLLASSSTQANLNAEKVRSLQLPLPPFTEQAAIVEYLDKATAEIDTAIARAKREVELLEEYRTRLVADVVTGKLDVRDAAAGLPEVDPLETRDPERPI